MDKNFVPKVDPALSVHTPPVGREDNANYLTMGADCFELIETNSTPEVLSQAKSVFGSYCQDFMSKHPTLDLSKLDWNIGITQPIMTFQDPADEEDSTVLAAVCYFMFVSKDPNEDHSKLPDQEKVDRTQCWALKLDTATRQFVGLSRVVTIRTH